MKTYVLGRFVVAQLRIRQLVATYTKAESPNLHKMLNETTGIDTNRSQMCCKLLTVIKPKAYGLESLPDPCPVPPVLSWLGSSCWNGVLWPELPIQMFCRAFERFPLLPDLQQGEQLCCKYQIAVSIIDFFQFLPRSWQSKSWQPEQSQQWGRRSFVLETFLKIYV